MDKRGVIEKGLVKIKEEQISEYDALSSKTNSNASGVSVKEETMYEENEPVEEQFIEISTNSYSKTNQSGSLGEKSKALTKDETRALLDLIMQHPIITSRETNASNNQQKIKVWTEITELFNARYSAHPRTAKQLRLKWDNLKKNARKRSAKIRLNRGKTDLNAEYVPRDQILERVTALLRSRHRRIPRSPSPQEADDCDSDDSDAETALRESLPLSTFVTQAPQTEEVLLPHPPETNVMRPSHSINGIPEQPRKKKLRSDEGREARNRAIANYYVTKTKLLEANLSNVHLQNEKLQIEIDLLKRKSNRLKP